MSFLPARMTRLLLGGHQAHLDAAIEVLHAEGVLHIEDYQDPTGSTTIGTPLERGDAVSALLVKVRGLQKSLGTEGVRAKPSLAADPERVFADAQAAAAGTIQSLAGLRSQAAALAAEQEALRPFAAFDFPLEAVSGLKSVKGFVGTSRTDPRAAMPPGASLAIEEHGAGFAVAAFVPAAQAAAAERALAEAGFSSAALPQRTATPAQRLAELHNELVAVRARLEAAEAAVATLRAEHGPRLAAAEAHLAREAEKTQAPLQFAVTASTFHVEGWVPRSRVNRVKNALAARFGDSLYVEELGDAPRHDAAPIEHREGGNPSSGRVGRLVADERAEVGAAHHKDPPAGTAPETHGDSGHHATEAKDEPPIHLENKGPAKPYEFLLGLLGKPRYHEIDPTKLMLVFFPLFFGLMVGDLVVGLLIMAVGLWLKGNRLFGIGGPAVGRALVMGGLMAAIVGGVVFGEALGIHFVTPEPHEEGEEKELSWEGILGLHIPAEGFIHKTGGEAQHLAEGTEGEGAAGTAPEGTGNGTLDTHAAASGIQFVPLQEEAHAEEEPSGGITGLLEPHSDVHLSVNGWFNLGYYSKIHDIQALLVWSVLIGFVHLVLGLVLGVRNVYVAHGAKLAIQEKAAWLLLIAGAIVLVMGLSGAGNAATAAGAGGIVAAVALLWAGAAHTLGVGFIALLEVPSLAGNLLSYTRLAAIGASKAGIALAVVALADLATGGVLDAVWWSIYVLGMLAITLLAILSGGLQSIRLQFVEFFGKFYQGGGRPYVPFGRRAP